MLLHLLLCALCVSAVKSSRTTILTVTRTTSTSTVSLPQQTSLEAAKAFCALYGLLPKSAGQTGEICEWDKTDNYKYVLYDFTVELVTSVVETSAAFASIASVLARLPALSLSDSPPPSSTSSLVMPLPASAAQTSQADPVPPSQAAPSVTTAASVQSFLVTSQYTSLVSTSTASPNQAGGGILTLTSTQKFVASSSTAVAPRYVETASRRLNLRGRRFWIVCAFGLFLLAGT